MKWQQGFSLIEMALVLVIIGLLAGGIMAGQTMIRNAELQAVIQEQHVLKTAISEFRDKFGQLPGDFSKAQTMWGTDAGGCPNVAYVSAPSTGTTTCNGDGNDRVGTSTSAGTLGNPYEYWRAWQHLANAQLIDGRYTGQRGSANTWHAMPALNVPASELDGGGWTLYYYQNTTDNALMYAEPSGGYGHLLHFGGELNGNITMGEILTPQDALQIDRKADDGQPGTGHIRAPRTGRHPNCTGSDTSKTNQLYKTAEQSNSCSILFILGL